MKDYLQLVRYPNLIIVALTQYAIRWGVIDPMLSAASTNLPNADFQLQLGSFQFFLLVLSTICLTAAGYVINDYFDIRTDFLNRPGKVLVGTKIPRRQAMVIHIILSFVGVLLGFYISFHIGIPLLGFIFLFISGMLWFYSTTYKRQFLIGNILVALMTGLVPLMVILFELPELNKEYGEILISYNTNLMYIFYWVLGFSVFAFLTNLTREIVKDMEDFEGDRIYGRNSIPVVLGIKNAKIVVNVLIITTLALLSYVYFSFLVDTITLIYFSLFLFLPFLFLSFKTMKAKNKPDYHLIGNGLKIIMLAGIIYAFVARFIIQTQIL
ncbi:MAG: geranylgeranylglycerol-phosphate geranylgeranyltransferase [Bacteroidota bacterium]